MDLLDAVASSSSVHISKPIRIISDVMGWTYFAAWSISFYPQLIENYFKKSVVGYSFDYLTYNITGFICYTIFNCTFFWSNTVHTEYRNKHCGGKNCSIPVQIQDVVFSIHALVLTLVLAGQTLIYERGGQRVSWTCIAISSVMWLFIIINLSLGGAGVTTWLFTINMIAYVKLTISLLKYIPQVYLNYKRKSTEGWNIINVLLDFTGGSLSILQQVMLAIAEKNPDMVSKDLPKTLLGFESIFFDVVFMVQHYILYRHPKNVEVIVTLSDEDENEKTPLTKEESWNDA